MSVYFPLLRGLSCGFTVVPKMSVMRGTTMSPMISKLLVTFRPLK